MGRFAWWGGDIQPLPWRKGLQGRPSLVIILLVEAQWHRRRSWSGSCRWQRLIFQGGGPKVRRHGTKWYPIRLSFHVSFPSTYATTPMGTTPLHPTAAPSLPPWTTVEEASIVRSSTSALSWTTLPVCRHSLSFLCNSRAPPHPIKGGARIFISGDQNKKILSKKKFTYNLCKNSNI